MIMLKISLPIRVLHDYWGGVIPHYPCDKDFKNALTLIPSNGSANIPILQIVGKSANKHTAKRTVHNAMVIGM